MNIIYCVYCGEELDLDKLPHPCKPNSSTGKWQDYVICPKCKTGHWLPASPNSVGANTPFPNKLS